MRAEMTGDIYLVIGDELRDVYLRWIGDVSRKKKIVCDFVFLHIVKLFNKLFYCGIIFFTQN